MSVAKIWSCDGRGRSSSCSRNSIASEYASSPEEQPGTQIRTPSARRRSRTSGITIRSSVRNGSSSRKKLVTLIVRSSARRRVSSASLSSRVAYSRTVAIPVAAIRRWKRRRIVLRLYRLKSCPVVRPTTSSACRRPSASPRALSGGWRRRSAASWTSAAGISSTGRTCSTIPVAIAAAGMLSYRASPRELRERPAPVPLHGGDAEGAVGAGPREHDPDGVLALIFGEGGQERVHQQAAALRLRRRRAAGRRPRRAGPSPVG